MATSKITERDIYNAMIDGTIDAETMAEFAEKKLAQLDKRNESAKKRAAKKRAESDELTEKIFELLSEEAMDRVAVFEALQADGVETTLGKITSRLSNLVKEGRANKAKGKAQGEDGKAHEVTFYTVA